MTNTLFLAAAAITLGGATYKAVGLRGRPSRPAQAFTVALYALGIALLLRAPLIGRPINDVLDVASLDVLTGNAMTMISACFVLMVLVYFTDPTDHQSRGRSRFWIIFLVVALLLMTGLFVWSLNPGGVIDRRSPQYVVYVLIYATYLTAAMTEACQLCLRHARHTADRYLRLGLQIVALGSALGILYCVILAYNLAASRTPLPGIGPDIVMSAVLPATCCVLLVIGSTIGGWGPRLGQGWQWLADYRSYRRLGPLWRALADVAPEVIPPRDMARLTIGQKRYRRIIEIRDLILTLRAYRDPELAAQARAHLTVATEPSLAELAAVEAAVIVDAIQAHREGRRPAGAPDVAMPAQLGADLATESRWLEAVSDALPRALAEPAGQPAAMSTEDGQRGPSN